MFKFISCIRRSKQFYNFWTEIEQLEFINVSSRSIRKINQNVNFITRMTLIRQRNTKDI